MMLSHEINAAPLSIEYNAQGVSAAHVSTTVSTFVDTYALTAAAVAEHADTDHDHEAAAPTIPAYDIARTRNEPEVVNTAGVIISADSLVRAHACSSHSLAFTASHSYEST